MSQLADGARVAFSFLAADAYISPDWYRTIVTVPTWNYITVHCWGRPRVVDDPAWLRRQIEDLTNLN